MATLANAGEQTTNESNPFNYAGVAPISENNPYQQALEGGAAANVFAGLPAKAQGANNPDPSAYKPTGSGQGLIGTGLIKSTGGQEADTVDQSVADTPEAAPAAQANAQQSKADLQQINHAISPKTAKAPPTPTEQQDINAALAPDQAELDQLPAEYKSIIAQLSPYMSGGEDTGNSALNAADANVSAVVGQTDNKVEAALSGLGKANKEYANTIPYSGIVQALLGFGKYEETYEGAQPQGQSNWTQSMDQIYQYLSGTNASSDGLSAPQTAASQSAQNQTSSSDSAGGGNA